MTIPNINRDNNLQQVQQKGNLEIQKDQQPLSVTDEKSSQAKSDKLEISNEAKKLQNTDAQTMLSIKANINSGYYNRPDVIKNVASEIDKAFPAEGSLSK